jgi:hypothetical protein
MTSVISWLEAIVSAIPPPLLVTPKRACDVDEAFAALDAMSAQTVRTGAPSDAITLVVVESATL